VPKLAVLGAGKWLEEKIRAFEVPKLETQERNLAPRGSTNEKPCNTENS